jgi:hypothetical protein
MASIAALFGANNRAYIEANGPQYETRDAHHRIKVLNRHFLVGEPIQGKGSHLQPHCARFGRVFGPQNLSGPTLNGASLFPHHQVIDMAPKLV